MKTDSFGEINGRWRKLLLDRFYIIAWVVFFTEAIIFFFDEWAGLLFLPIPLYLFRFLFLPSLLNFLAVGVASLMNQSDHYTDETKDFIVSLACFAVCACVELTHYVFAPVLCAPTIAIYISSIFKCIPCNLSYHELSLLRFSLKIFFVNKKFLYYYFSLNLLTILLLSCQFSFTFTHIFKFTFV